MNNMAKSKTYDIDVVCSNCDYTGKAFIPKKQKVDDTLDSIECPICECKTLSRKEKIKEKRSILTKDINPSPYKRFPADFNPLDVNPPKRYKRWRPYFDFPPTKCLQTIRR